MANIFPTGGNSKTKTREIQIPKAKLSSYTREGVAEYLNTVGFEKKHNEQIIFHVVEFLDVIIVILQPQDDEMILQDSLTVDFELNIDTLKFNTATSQGSNVTANFHIE